MALALEQQAADRAELADQEQEEAHHALDCAQAQRAIAEREYEQARDQVVGSIVRALNGEGGPASPPPAPALARACSSCAWALTPRTEQDVAEDCPRCGTKRWRQR